MKKNATLIIRDLRMIYTCVKHEIKTKESIVIYQDRIIAITKEIQPYIDKDTKIIDGSSCFAIPSFIDAGTQFIFDGCFDHERAIHAHMRECVNDGTTTFSGNRNFSFYNYSVIETEQKGEILDLDMALEEKRWKRRSSISGRGNNNQLLCAKICFKKFKIEPEKMLDLLVINPARQLNLNAGIKTNYKANLLIVGAKDLEAFFLDLMHTQIRYVIKDGIVVFPRLLR